MKNITVSVDEETYRLCRVKAAEADTSVSALVRDYLRDIALGRSPQPEFERLRSLQKSVIDELRATGGGLRSSENIPRDELYDRNALS